MGQHFGKANCAILLKGMKIVFATLFFSSPEGYFLNLAPVVKSGAYGFLRRQEACVHPARAERQIKRCQRKS